MQQILVALQQEKSSSYRIFIFVISLFDCRGRRLVFSPLCTLLGTVVDHHPYELPRSFFALRALRSQPKLTQRSLTEAISMID